MEKSWENFWTTGKVEDYLTYRNRVTDDERPHKQKDTDWDRQQSEAKEIQFGKDITIQNRSKHMLF